MNFLLIAGGVILFIIIWLAADFYMGQKRHLLHAFQRQTGVLHSHFDIFKHGKELFDDFFEEVRMARHHVHVLFYIVKEDQFSREFLGLLKDKARAGLEVRLLLDRLGSWRMNRKIVRDLNAAGVQVAFSDKVRLPFLFYSSQVRNHRKITVIDGKVGYLGGFNIGKEYIDEKPKLSPWRDYHLKITGEGVSYLQSEFFSDWRRSTNESLQGAGATGLSPRTRKADRAALKNRLAYELGSEPLQTGLGKADRAALQNRLANEAGGGPRQAELDGEASNGPRYVGLDGNVGVEPRYVGLDGDATRKPRQAQLEDEAGSLTGQRNLLWEMGSMALPSHSSAADRGESPYFPKLDKGDIRHQFIPTEAGQLEGRFISLLQKADKQVLIGTPYFIPSKRLFAELMALVKRGVKVTVIVPYTADHPLVREASYRYLRRLLREGAVVYQYKNGFYHAKTLIIDDKICDIGTANFDKRSLYLNKEMNCYLYDSNFIAQLKEVVNKDLLDSEPLKLETLTKPNPFRTLKELIAGTLSYFL